MSEEKKICSCGLKFENETDLLKHLVTNRDHYNATIGPPLGEVLGIRKPETELIKCEECGHETEISWRRRRSKPRFCRHCGAKIAEPQISVDPFSSLLIHMDKPLPGPGGRGVYEEADNYYEKPAMDEYLAALDAKILQIHECLGQYESKEWCDHCLIDAACARVTMELHRIEDVKNHINPLNLSTYGLDLRVGTRANINSKDLHAFLNDLKEKLGVKL